VLAEVDVLDTEAAAFEKPKSRAVQEHRHEPRRPCQRTKHREHLVAGEHDRQPLRPFRAHDVVQPLQIDSENIAVQEG
jgi:hypothetical protein